MDLETILAREIEVEVRDVDLFEIGDVFGSVSVATSALGIDREIWNALAPVVDARIGRG